MADATTGELKFTCDAHEGYWVNCVAYSLDGTRIATCSNDGTICVWDADNGKRLLDPFDCQAEAVLSITFSPDRNVLLSGNGVTHIVSDPPGNLLICCRERR